MTDLTYRDAMRAANLGDVPPEQVAALDLGSGLPVWGWSDAEVEDWRPQFARHDRLLAWAVAAVWLAIVVIVAWARLRALFGGG